MALTPVLCAQLAISVIAVLLNGTGIYCIRRCKKGNWNQLLLLQNLAWLQLVKSVYDYVPWTIYHFNPMWYTTNYKYFAVLEINMMTLMYGCFGLITLDRFLCVVLKIDYSKYITASRMKSVIYTMWTVSMTPGVFLWGIFNDIGVAKLYYYLVADVIIALLIVITYTIIIKSIVKRNNELDLKGAGNMKMQVMSVLLMVTFVLTNGVPDLIFLLDTEWHLYDLVSILWSLGYILDPILYIFTAQKMRKIAMTALAKFITCGRVKDFTTLTWFTTKKTNESKQQPKFAVDIPRIQKLELSHQIEISRVIDVDNSWVQKLQQDAMSMTPTMDVPGQSTASAQKKKEEEINPALHKKDVLAIGVAVLTADKTLFIYKGTAFDEDFSATATTADCLCVPLWNASLSRRSSSHADQTLEELDKICMKMSRSHSLPNL